MYADETTLYVSIELITTDSLKNDMSNNLLYLNKWIKFHRPPLNIAKTRLMILKKVKKLFTPMNVNHMETLFILKFLKVSVFIGVFIMFDKLYDVPTCFLNYLDITNHTTNNNTDTDS